MNAPRKNKALKSIEGMSAEDAAFALQNDPAGYTEAEQKEILEAHTGAPAEAPKTTKPAPAPKDLLQDALKDFNYAGDFKGQSFRDYNRLMETLDGDKKYDFEVFKVHPIREVRYEGVDGSPKDIVGVRILEPQPMKTTRVPAKMMREFNGRIQEGTKGDFFTIIGGHFHNVGSAVGSFGEYYLLKKQ